MYLLVRFVERYPIVLIVAGLFGAALLVSEIRGIRSRRWFSWLWALAGLNFIAQVLWLAESISSRPWAGVGTLAAVVVGVVVEIRWKVFGRAEAVRKPAPPRVRPLLPTVLVILPPDTEKKTEPAGPRTG
jgi:hypothetical protein